MKMATPVYGLVLLCLALGCNDSSRRTGGGGTDGGGGGACTNVGGDWTITDHCTSAFVGMVASVSQSGCSFTIGPPFDGFAGTTGSDGSISVTGSIEGTTITCTGTASTSAIDLSCNGDCSVRMSRGAP